MLSSTVHILFTSYVCVCVCMCEEVVNLLFFCSLLLFNTWFLRSHFFLSHSAYFLLFSLKNFILHPFFLSSFSHHTHTQKKKQPKTKAKTNKTKQTKQKNPPILPSPPTKTTICLIKTLTVLVRPIYLYIYRQVNQTDYKFYIIIIVVVSRHLTKNNIVLRDNTNRDILTQIFPRANLLKNEINESIDQFIKQ